MHPSFRLLILLLLPLAAPAQQFHFRHYSLGEGLAQSQVYALCQARNGTIWMGTRGGGLSAFDGIRFSNYTTRQGLVDNYILCLAEDSAGLLWIGTNNGLCTYNGRSFSSIALPDSGTIVVESILPGSPEGLLIGTQKGIFRKRTGAFERFMPGEPSLQQYITSLFCDGRKRIWAGSNGGVTCIDGKTVTHYTTKQGLPGNDIRCITEDAGGTIWVGTYGQGIAWIMPDGGIRPVTAREQLPDPIIQAFHRDAQNRIWIGTQEAGAGYWNPADSLFHYLTERDGLSNNHIRCIIDDAWGSTWIGTSGGGVSKYSGQQFTHFDQRSGLPGRNVYTMAEDSSGTLWFSTSAGGLCRLEGNLVKDFSRSEGFPTVKIKKLFTDWQNRLWIGTEGAGLYLYDSTGFRPFGNEGGLGSGWIRDILQDAAGNFWIAKAGGGIAHLQEEDGSFRIRNFSMADGLPEDRINALARDREGRTWFATASKGIGYLLGDSVYTFTTRDGLNSQKIRSLALSPNGLLWAGSADRGICSIAMQNGKPVFRTISTKDGLTSDNIYLLGFDREGRLWVGSEKGLDRLVFHTDGSVEEIHPFGYTEGFTGIETSQNAVLADKKGNLWFGTINGLTRLNPSLTQANTKPPVLQLRDIRLFFRPLPETPYAAFWEQLSGKSDTLELPYNQNHLSFDFFGVNHRSPEQVRYQWKLAGLDETWTPPGFQHSVTYSNLPPGRYTFYFRAANEDGLWSEAQAVHFRISPPIWLRWWFITAAVLLVILLAGLYFRWRLRRIKRKAFEAQEKLRLETDVLKLEQKALQLQMNPHFIFNALNSIQALIGTQDEKTARYYLSKFSSLMRQILESSREQVIPLEMEIRILEHYLSIEQFSHGVPFKWDITTDPQINPESTGILPMLIHPFVENAVIHGLIPRGPGGSIRIVFSREGDQLRVTIRDNGIGRQKALARRAQQDQHHKSTALLVVQERLGLLSGDTHIEITDLENEQGEAIGTEVRVRLPWVEL